MKNFDWKKLAPHGLAIVLFLLVSIFYCLPAFQGKVLDQHDVTQWQGMAKQGLDVQKATGELPLWNVTMFGGMPNYQISMEPKSLLVDFSGMVIGWLPKPANFFFLACLCFYFLTAVALRLRPAVAAFGALSFAFATYNPAIIIAGHDTKMMAMSYMPALLGGLIMIFDKRYVAGLVATAYFASYQIASNHFQITFYLLIAMGLMTVAYVIRWVMAKEFKHLAIALGLALFGGLIGIGNNLVSLVTTQEYGQYTMRGGKDVSINEKGEVKKADTKGLDTDYALSYSIHKAEALVQVMPNAFGGGSSNYYTEDDPVAGKLTDQGLPAQVATQLPRYWGGLEFTAGPAYLGVLACLVFVAALGVSRNKHKWWILAAVVFSLLMAWGSYNAGFSHFLLENFPLYNKFRAPSMALVICQLVVPMLAALFLQELIAENNDAATQKALLKKLAISLGAFTGLLLLIYLANDYAGAIDEKLVAAFSNPQQGGNEQLARGIVNTLREDRKGMFLSGVLRTIGFGVLVLAGFWALVGNRIKPVYVILAFAAINLFDLLSVDSKYLNKDTYQYKDEVNTNNFVANAADQQILADKTLHYRVFNVAGDRFAETRTSYFHKSVGGYHAAKLRLFQDVIEKYFSGNIASSINLINMMNARWFLVPGQQPNEPQMAQPNPDAYGNAWWATQLIPAADPAAALTALAQADKGKTVVYNADLAQMEAAADSAGTVALTKFSNDRMEYNANSASGGLAVFSEVYYPKGWKAFVDGKEVPHFAVNYLLRGVQLPAGQHNVVFEFKPAAFYNSQTIVYVVNVLFWLILIGGIVYLVWQDRRRQNQAA